MTCVIGYTYTSSIQKFQFYNLFLKLVGRHFFPISLSLTLGPERSTFVLAFHNGRIPIKRQQCSIQYSSKARLCVTLILLSHFLVQSRLQDMLPHRSSIPMSFVSFRVSLYSAILRQNADKMSHV